MDTFAQDAVPGADAPPAPGPEGPTAFPGDTAGEAPVLSGRDDARLRTAAAAAGLTHRTARLDDPGALHAALDGIAVVLNAAGPFSRTAETLADACLARGIHYLDLCGEVPVLERLSHLHQAARARGVMLLPAAGFDVVPTDCLAAHVARRMTTARSLTLAVSRPAFLSPGSARTLLDHVDLGVARRDGVIRQLRLGSVERVFDFGAGPRPCLNVSFSDVVTAHHTTGIPSITTFAEATPLLRLLPFGLWRHQAAHRHRRSGGRYARGCGLIRPTVDPRASDARRREAEDDGRWNAARLSTPKPTRSPARRGGDRASRPAGDVEPGSRRLRAVRGRLRAVVRAWCARTRLMATRVVIRVAIVGGGCAAMAAALITLTKVDVGAKPREARQARRPRVRSAPRRATARRIGLCAGTSSRE
jgi:hypothetical protein